MTQALGMAVAGAAAVAMFSAFFGVATARLVWADDLKHAQSIDAIRSRTEAALRGQIEALQKQVEILKH